MEMIKRLYELDVKEVLLLSLAFSAFLFVSALVIEHGFGAEPCQMCWWQRWGQWAIGGFAFLGLVLPSGIIKRLSVWLIVFAALASGGVGVYQTLGQLGYMELPASCTGGGAGLAGSGDLMASLSGAQNLPDCSDWGFTVFGLSLAMWNMLVMGAFVAFLSKWILVSKRNG